MAAIQQHALAASRASRRLGDYRIGRIEFQHHRLLLDVVESVLHANPSEWVFLRELRVGTGFRNTSLQRLDAFALNCFAHLGMKRICYEVKTSRADYLCEMKHPLKRRLGMRYSNEFYFVTQAGMLTPCEVPVECGLIEIEGGFPVVKIPAPWRETPGPTWQFVASMIRNQRRVFEERVVPPSQQRFGFE
ncbi:MAG: hypothetical protein SGI92_08955 [Bryobacteraceae bacterium]|nr:hypothetical protein [Bryobacteraceae bacterium]